MLPNDCRSPQPTEHYFKRVAVTTICSMAGTVGVAVVVVTSVAAFTSALFSTAVVISMKSAVSKTVEAALSLLNVVFMMISFVGRGGWLVVRRC
jgi:hypothetical protein